MAEKRRCTVSRLLERPVKFQRKIVLPKQTDRDSGRYSYLSTLHIQDRVFEFILACFFRHNTLVTSEVSLGHLYYDTSHLLRRCDGRSWCSVILLS
jgi:hypothetical protein